MNHCRSTHVFATMLAITLAGSLAGAAPQDAKINPDFGLVGVWETVAPAFSDCATGEPLPDSPTIRVLQTFHGDGTMTEDNTDSNDGPYRTTAHGIWQRVDSRQFRTSYMHYSFSPDRTHTLTIKIRSTITLTRDQTAFREQGEFDLVTPQDELVFTGCFNSGFRARRVGF